jgi:arsenite methyltransferase
MSITMDAHQESIRKYRTRAAGYDASAARTMPLRLRTIERLQLQPGDVVIDVGAGTGLSFGPLLERVGPTGRVLACEQSPEMFTQAEARVAREGWQGCVWQACGSAEETRFPQAADAVLFNYVHDVVRSPAAVANILAQVKPGGRIAMAGMKFFPWWTGPLNLLAWAKNRPYNARPADLWSPWDRVQPYCAEFTRTSTQAGMGYIAWGRLRAEGDLPA